MERINIRYYQTGDAEKIYSLLAKHTLYLRDADFWVWINRILPVEDSIIAVAENNLNEIIGHYAVLPCYIWVNGYRLKGGLGLHAFVDPSYRDRVSIFEISKLAYKKANELNLKFIYGFPNSNYRLIQERIEKWNRVALFNAYTNDISNLLQLDSEFDLTFENCTDNYTDYFKLSNLLDRVRDIQKEKYVQVDKNLNQYINRYILHPQKLYKNFFIKYNDEIVGFVVIKRFDSGTKNLHIIDYLLLDDKYIKSMILKSITIFDDIDRFVSWHFNTQFKSVLESLNFKQDGFETFFGIKFLDNNLELEIKSYLLNFDKWDLAMGDSDAF